MAQPHDILLEHLTASGNVQLVARLHDPVAVGNTDATYLHVFVPDLHLVSDEVRKTYQYGFDWRTEFTALTTALLKTWDALQQAGHRFTVTQLGDFVDLWRQSDNDPRGVRTILETFPDIRDRFLRNAEDSLGARLLLGNHDLEAREARDFARARMIHYLPGTAGTLAATHGDAFDVAEIIVPDHIASFVLQTFGRLATPRTYDMEKLRTLRDQTTTSRDERTRIQGDATLAGLLASTEAFPDRWSVIEVHQAQDRLKAHHLLPNAVRAVQTLRTEPDSDGQPAAPNLTVLVIGHTHHARLVVDHTANLVMMDCGAWIESYQVAREPKRPNRQIGAVCGADLRIYQFD
jgi:UDP-2,3-diacylglucosamine pyrophosphatase LpxH